MYPYSLKVSRNSMQRSNWLLFSINGQYSKFIRDQQVALAKTRTDWHMGQNHYKPPPPPQQQQPLARGKKSFYIQFLNFSLFYMCISLRFKMNLSFKTKYILICTRDDDTCSYLRTTLSTHSSNTVNKIEPTPKFQFNMRGRGKIHFIYFSWCRSNSPHFLDINNLNSLHHRRLDKKK